MADYSPLLPVRKIKADLTSPHMERDAWAERFPRCYALFAESVGSLTPERLPATLTVFCDGGRLKACWSDRSTNMVLFLALDTAQGFWEQMETYLETHMDDWAPKRKGR